MRSAIVPPFYDSESGAPPPFPPMLTDQLELFGNVDRRPTTLTADEVLVPRAGIVPVARVSSSTPAPEFKLAKRTLKHSDPSSSACPYPKKSLTRSRSQTPLPSDSAHSLDSLSDSGTSTSSASLSEDSKIPKPAGEPGRPGHGGYTLYEALDWNPKAYTKFKVRSDIVPLALQINSRIPKKHVHSLVEDHLDITKCASAQSPALLKVVRDKVNSFYQS
jgi:hypothetical protein